MSDDLLAKMASALREEHDGATAFPEATRARVVRTLAERKPRRKKWWTVGVPAFVLLGGSTAWASATGQLPLLIEKTVQLVTGTAPEDESEKAAPARPARSPLARQASEPESAFDAADSVEGAQEADVQEEAAQEETAPPQKQEEQVEPPQTQQVQRQHNQIQQAQKNLRGDGSKEAPVAPEDAVGLSVYREAHDAHFKQGDCDKAVRLYQKYLSEVPSGSFALEARYNRGVCLLKLGRTEEAVSALRPFADGAYGEYRRASSKELLDAVSAK